ncbi:hypothetical protein HYY75_03160 [bacterium]|nr:hypothetical protein [bacterium]
MKKLPFNRKALVLLDYSLPLRLFEVAETPGITGAIIFLVMWFFSLAIPLSAWQKWEFIHPSDVEIRLKPDNPEVVSGETATFSLIVYNKSDKPLSLPFKTGHRWDMAVYHYDTQIWRSSNGQSWEEAPNSISILPRQTEIQRLSWKAIDRLGNPLPQGIYRAEGIAMLAPRHLISNKVSIRLLPPTLKKNERIRVKIHQTFEIEVPHYIDGREVQWIVDYVYNDNRISHLITRATYDKFVWVFRGDRPGRVTMYLYAFPPFKGPGHSLERRTYPVEVVLSD